MNQPEPAGLRDAVGLPGKIAIGVLCLWSIGFALHGIGLSLVHVFRTADIHEVVPPVLAGVLVWEMALPDVLTGAYPQVPAGARAVSRASGCSGVRVTGPKVPCGGRARRRVDVASTRGNGRGGALTRSAAWA
ncbi:hypothetical protein [Streptomyces sp. NPDC058412]|uniref:hypothetical protein n=1 Tax=Streptomyces sp. NPDC058412 TaxID=3346486 RepID=UPI0036623A46